MDRRKEIGGENVVFVQLYASPQERLIVIVFFPRLYLDLPTTSDGFRV
jgi:hypothetical protein